MGHGSGRRLAKMPAKTLTTVMSRRERAARLSTIAERMSPIDRFMAGLV
jgi:hypothetical protein